MEELGRKSIQDFKQARKIPLVIVLDNIRSMHNVGSIFRTADGFLASGIFLCGYTPQPPHRDIQKTALGATETIDWIYFPTTLQAVEQLKSEGYRVFAIEQVEGSIMLNNFEGSPDEKYAIILGNEVSGVDEEVLKLCDGAIEIPQEGMKHSLNVSIAAGIVAWEFFKFSSVGMIKNSPSSKENKTDKSAPELSAFSMNPMNQQNP
jgi:tRNA G18 (ribose-2'-O)-methylase SpoU